jgi:Rps23 Pro-64 3,4-dihydroxylase Tpa1-like proline 4-hydroxylase
MEVVSFTEPVTFCIIKNFYTKDEIDIIKTELLSLKPTFGGPDKTGSAYNLVNKVKKSNKGVFVRQGNPITILNRKVFSPELVHDLSKLNWFYSYLGHLNSDSTLVSYYEDGDYYKPHRDKSILTAIYYIWDEPKRFTGGELYFGNLEILIENNSLLIFPSITEHEVRPVQGCGRFAISQFITMKEHNEPIVRSYKNVCTVLDFIRIQKTIENGSWTTHGTSGMDSKVKFLYMNLISDPFFTETLKEQIESMVGRKLVLERVYANGQYPGLDGTFHQDNKSDGTFTFILYVNNIEKEELDEFHGTTEFKINESIRAFQPDTNSGLFFPSNIWHRGRSPTRFFPSLRITVAWKLYDPSLYHP